MNRLLIISIVLLASCSTTAPVHLAHRSLYPIATPIDSSAIDGFTATTIFDESIDKSFWVSPETQCVTAEKESQNTLSGTTALHIKWDKITGGCDWIGIGFGWNNWQPKDISQILDQASIEFYVKSAHGTFKNLPVAFALEDYTGVQSYYGFTPELVDGDFREDVWRKVSIPLSLFPFDQKDGDPSLVKQFMIQLEGDGDIYLDKINIVRNENL